MRQSLAPLGGWGKYFTGFVNGTKLNLNIEVQIRKGMLLFLNGQNVFNDPYITQIYSSQTPEYAKRNFTNHNGVGLTLGIKDSF